MGGQPVPGGYTFEGSVQGQPGPLPKRHRKAARRRGHRLALVLRYRWAARHELARPPRAADATRLRGAGPRPARPGIPRRAADWRREELHHRLHPAAAPRQGMDLGLRRCHVCAERIRASFRHRARDIDRGGRAELRKSAHRHPRGAAFARP